MIKSISFLIILLVLGCTSKQEQVLPTSLLSIKKLNAYTNEVDRYSKFSISFKKEIEYSDLKNNVVSGTPGDIAVDSSGRVYIADLQKKEINVFDINGNLITTFGRKGVGPGEFNGIKSLQVFGNSLYVFDPSQFRVSVFSLSSLSNKKTIIVGGNKSNFPILRNTYPWIHEIYIRGDTTFIAEFISNRSESKKEWDSIETEGVFYLLDRSGEIVGDELFSLTEDTRVNFRGLIVPVTSFYGSGLSAVMSDNSIYISEPQEKHFLIKVLNEDGSYSHSFYYPIDKIPLTYESAIRVDSSGPLAKNMKSISLPEKWPVVNRMKVDSQDRLWVAITVSNMSDFEWWVLTPKGELVTRFFWPRNKPIRLIQDGFIYTSEILDENNTQHIVKYSYSLN